MKYSTQQLYGHNPKELAILTHYEALQLSKQGAEQTRFDLVNEDDKVLEWHSEKESFVKYLSKSIRWCEYKLDEMKGIKVGRFCLFATHIKLAFRALWRR